MNCNCGTSQKEFGTFVSIKQPSIDKAIIPLKLLYDFLLDADSIDDRHSDIISFAL